MTSLAVYAFGCFALAFILGHATISELPRAWIYNLGWPGKKFAELLECPGCLGFWLGFIYGLWHRVGFVLTVGIALATSGSTLFLALFSGLIARPHTTKDAGSAAGALAAAFENHRFGRFPPPVCTGTGRWPVTMVGTGGGTCGICGRVVSIAQDSTIAVHPYVTEED